MKIQMGPLARMLAVLAAAPLLAAACSVANPFAPSSAAAKSAAEQAQLKWAQCMRQHGENVPDPDSSGFVRIRASGNPNAGQGNDPSSSSGSSPNPNPSSGGNIADDPQMTAAMEACKQYQPNGGKPSAQQQQQQLDAAIKFAQCMRDHGIPMEDPQPQSGGGIKMTGGQNGPGLNSDQFQAAQKACQHFLDEARPKS
jgi:hypothetical protein